ncbi:MAG: DUF488 domain-containing protein [Lachnospiraceae bacterium]|nr:DUF488 domain-containing protein [Lachnospiraceae bacterium]
MEIRTSYFAQLRKIEAMAGAVPVAVCRYPPDWYKGAVYQKVAPDYSMIMGMKNADTREYFKLKYLKDVLGRSEPGSVEKDITAIVERNGGAFAVLLCFEKPADFCHRHLVADWLGRNPDEAELKW